MSKQYKRSFRFYSAWNYEREIEDLNRASEQGWQLVHGGCFHNRFVKNPGIRYRYQLDFGKIEDMGRYIETFREQGWEYMNSTFNGWHYLRKLYDPALPEEAYEIFTDRESLHEMNSRWARIALGIGIALALFAVFYAVRFFSRPNLPYGIQLLMFLMESVILLRGSFLMRNPDASRNRRGDSTIVALLLAVIVLGSAASITLSDLRPHFWTEQKAAAIDEPIRDRRWGTFKVKYPDCYYLDLKLEGPSPVTFEVIREDGESVYRASGEHFEEKRIRLVLPRGEYCFSLTCDDAYHVAAELD